MKQKYFLFTLTFLAGLVLSYGQNCPESIGNQSNTTEVHFKITSGTCNDYPNDITIDGKSFSQSGCNGTNMYYTVNPPDTPLSSPDTFTADFGFGVCSYVNGQLQTLSNPEIDPLSGFSIHPNPVSGDGIVNIKFKTPVQAAISVYDLTGKRLIQTVYDERMNVKIDLSEYANGIYLMRIQSEFSNLTRKIILQR